MKKLWMAAFAMLPAGALLAQNVTGTWQGTLQPPQAKQGLRIVIKGAAITKRIQQGCGINEAAARRIRRREVGNRQTRLPAQPVRARQLAFLGVPSGSLGKTHGFGFLPGCDARGNSPFVNLEATVCSAQ